MRIVLITQNDVFYLPDALAHLLRGMPPGFDVVAAVVLGVSPFGGRETFLSKALKTLRIFGWSFFIRYSIRYVLKKLKRRDVISVLKEHGVPVIELDKGINDPSSLDTLKSYAPDVLVSIAGNQIFRRPLIDLPPRGTLNLHTALLPKYRGLMPTFWVLKNGEAETGVSVFFVDEGIDSGPIVVQKRIAIGGQSQEELIVATKRLGMDAIIEALTLIEHGDYELLPNDDAEQSYFSFPTREDVVEFRRAGKRFY